MMGTSVIVCEDREGIARRALDLVVDGLRTALHLRGEAHLALTGGSSAAALFGLLRSDPRAHRVDWTHVHVWQGDERFVPLDHPDRNWSVALRDWLAVDGGPSIPEEQLHPIPCDVAIENARDPAWAAARYTHDIEEALPRRDGTPAFDVILLGVGGDGHILSAFPDTPAVAERTVPVLPVAAPTHIEPHLPRVTLAPFLLGAARSIVVMVPGAGKARVVADSLTSPLDARRWPAQLAIRPSAAWLLEPASAAAL